MPGSHIMLNMHPGLRGFEVAFAARFNLHDRLGLSVQVFEVVSVWVGEQACTYQVLRT